MGGRLDATNAIDPSAVLITNVALDHCDWLGDDVETIAAEKAGVMRPGIPVVYGDEHVPEAITGHADDIGAQLLLRGRDFDVATVPRPGLPGDFQQGNAAAVVALLAAAGLDKAANSELAASVLPDVRLTGRGQRLEREKTDTNRKRPSIARQKSKAPYPRALSRKQTGRQQYPSLKKVRGGSFD